MQSGVAPPGQRWGAEGSLETLVESSPALWVWETQLRVE